MLNQLECIIRGVMPTLEAMIYHMVHTGHRPLTNRQMTRARFLTPTTTKLAGKWCSSPNDYTQTLHAEASKQSNQLKEATKKKSSKRPLLLPALAQQMAKNTISTFFFSFSLPGKTLHTFPTSKKIKAGSRQSHPLGAGADSCKSAFPSLTHHF